VARNGFFDFSVRSVAGLSGGGLLYLHAFTSIIGSTSPKPNVRLNGEDAPTVATWYDGGPGGKR
jgi:hypothetical protein